MSMRMHYIFKFTNLKLPGRIKKFPNYEFSNDFFVHQFSN